MNQYFYSDGQSQFGPFSKEELHSKGITKETLVWYEGLTEWVKAGESDELKDLFPKVPTPPPLPNSITPPPIPKQETQTPSTSIEKETTARSSFSESVKHESVEPTEKTIKKADNVSIPKRNLPEPKSEKKSAKKPIIVVSIILICVVILAIIIGVANESGIYKSFPYYEKEHPEQYLHIENENIAGLNRLEGYIHNSSRNTIYGNIQIAFSYYDQNGEVLQTTIYTIDGSCLPGESIPFNVKIHPPQGLKNLLKWGSWGVVINGAVGY